MRVGVHTVMRPTSAGTPRQKSMARRGSYIAMRASDDDSGFGVPGNTGAQASQNPKMAPPQIFTMDERLQRGDTGKYDFLEGKNLLLDSDARARANKLLELADDKVAEFMKIAGFRGGVGKRVKYGVLQEPVNQAEVDAIPESRREELRQKAAEELTNIDQEERDRRALIGQILLSSTALLAVLAYIRGDPWWLRFIEVILPLNAGLGFSASAREGL